MNQILLQRSKTLVVQIGKKKPKSLRRPAGQAGAKLIIFYIGLEYDLILFHLSGLLLLNLLYHQLVIILRWCLPEGS